MARFFKYTVVLCAALFCVGAQTVFAQMTDDQVVAFVQQASSQGRSQNDIATELLSRGVSMEQVTRLKEQYSAADGSNTLGAELGEEQAGTPNARQIDTRTSDILKAGKNIRDIYVMYEARTSVLRDSSVVFGHDIFHPRVDGISFQPNENAATPADYVLGPGDEVIIEIWGYNEARVKQVISPEGKISIKMVGPVYLSGLTVAQAEEKIRKTLVSKYSDIAGDNPNTEVSVSLGKTRTIQVNVMGDVDFPGAYRLSSFSTVFSALYAAGGVSKTGSLRDIQVLRGGKVIATADIYAYIFNGKSTTDVRLNDGDIVLVPAYVNVVKVTGGVKRPMKYEMAKGETVADLLKYCGGFAGNAYKDNVSVLRNSGSSRSVLTASAASSFAVELCDGDVVTVGVHQQHFDNRLEVVGYVTNPGEYEFGGDITSVRGLIAAAGGLREDAFLGRAVLKRERADRSYETLSVDLGAIMRGTRPDVALRANDILTVTGIYDIKERGTLTINGLVNRPGVFDYADNTTIEDLIVLAGGLADGASLAKVDVSRRVMDPYSLEIKENIGESFTFGIKDGLAVDGADKFVLQPYDVVSVRRSPAYLDHKFVRVNGEVAFPGEYVLQSNGERISSVIKRAGGLTNLAFVKGGKLIRRMTAEEKETAAASLETERRNLERQKRRLAINQGTSAAVDASDLEALQVSDTYTVAVDFAMAILHPGSSYDIILREGDVLSIPENVGTVAIKGEVLFPNTVAYIEGKPVRYYVDQAGGYNDFAKSSRLYVVYMNGSVERGLGARIEPGCEIVVPRKPERKAMTAPEILSIGTSTATLSTMVISLVNMLKK